MGQRQPSRPRPEPTLGSSRRESGGKPPHSKRRRYYARLLLRRARGDGRDGRVRRRGRGGAPARFRCRPTPRPPARADPRAGAGDGGGAGDAGCGCRAACRAASAPDRSRTPACGHSGSWGRPAPSTPCRSAPAPYSPSSRHRAPPARRRPPAMPALAHPPRGQDAASAVGGSQQRCPCRRRGHPARARPGCCLRSPRSGTASSGRDLHRVII